MKRLGGMSDLVTVKHGRSHRSGWMWCFHDAAPALRQGRAFPCCGGYAGVFLLLIFPLLCMPFAAMAQAGTPNDITNIRSAGVLRVSITNFDLPGFRTRDGRTLSGPEVDLAHQIAAVLGVTVRFVDTAGSFDTVIDDIAEGRADIGISKLSQTYSRMLRVRFSNPYVTLRHSLLFSRASMQSAQMASLWNRHCGISMVVSVSLLAAPMRKQPIAISRRPRLFRWIPGQL